MNIFVTDRDPFIAAQNLCDAHVVKMILESCQLLSTQDRLHGLTEGRYKMTHVNHPCRLCLENSSNYLWLELHLKGLLREYQERFGKRHKSGALFGAYWWGDTAIAKIKTGLCPDMYYRPVESYKFPQCMPEEFKEKDADGTVYTDIDSVVEAYRRYYKHKKETLKRFKYTNREPPEWL